MFKRGERLTPRVKVPFQSCNTSMTSSRILLSAALVLAAATASSGARPGDLTSDGNATRVSRRVQAESLLDDGSYDDWSKRDLPLVKDR